MSWQVINLRKLDEGGFAEVYLGNRSDNGEQVVVKFLRDDTPDNRRYFMREVRILGQRLHRRIVSLLGGRTEGPRPYYIMPYYPGGSLSRWAGKLTHAQIRAAARQLAEVLDALHRCEIVHGDVKPDNGLLTKTGHLRLGDPLGNGAGCTVTFSANRGGTAGYWAPEIAQGGPISKAGDVFSFGATLYHLVTGHRPEDGQNLDPRVGAVVVPDDIRNIIIGCCQRNPQSRPTMSAMVQALPEAPAEEQTTHISQPSPRPDAGKALAVVGGIVLGGLLLSGLFGAGNNGTK